MTTYETEPTQRAGHVLYLVPFHEEVHAIKSGALENLALRAAELSRVATRLTVHCVVNSADSDSWRETYLQYSRSTGEVAAKFMKSCDPGCEARWQSTLLAYGGGKANVLNRIIAEAPDSVDYIVGSDAKISAPKSSSLELVRILMNNSDINSVCANFAPYPLPLYEDFLQENGAELSPEDKFWYQFLELKKLGALRDTYPPVKFRAGHFAVRASAWEPIPRGIEDDHFIGRNQNTKKPGSSRVAMDVPSYYIPRYRLDDLLTTRFKRNGIAEKRLRAKLPELADVKGVLPYIEDSTEQGGTAQEPDLFLNWLVEVKEQFDQFLTTWAGHHPKGRRILQKRLSQRELSQTEAVEDMSFDFLRGLMGKGYDPADAAQVMICQKKVLDRVKVIVAGGKLERVKDGLNRAVISIDDEQIARHSRDLGFTL